MPNVNLHNALLVAIASAYSQGRYGTPDDLKAAGAQVGAQGPDISQALEELFNAGRVTEGPSETEFGLSQEALDYANGLMAQAEAPQPAPAAPAPAPVATTPAPSASKSASKKSASKKPQTAAAAAPTAQNEEGGEEGFRMKYTQADRLTVAELAQRVEVGLAAAEANYGAGQTIVAELIMRTLARLQRRLNKAQKEGLV